MAFFSAVLEQLSDRMMVERIDICSGLSVLYIFTLLVCAPRSRESWEQERQTRITGRPARTSKSTRSRESQNSRQ